MIDFLFDKISDAPTYVVVLAIIGVIWLVREIRKESYGNKNKHDN